MHSLHHSNWIDCRLPKGNAWAEPVGKLRGHCDRKHPTGDGRGTGVQTTLFWQGRCLGWSLIITSTAQFRNKIRLIFYVSYMNLYSTYCIYVHMSFVDIELICLTYMRVLKESICIWMHLHIFLQRQRTARKLNLPVVYEVSVTLTTAWPKQLQYRDWKDPCHTLADHIKANSSDNPPKLELLSSETSSASMGANGTCKKDAESIFLQAFSWLTQVHSKQDPKRNWIKNSVISRLFCWALPSTFPDTFPQELLENCLDKLFGSEAWFSNQFGIESIFG